MIRVGLLGAGMAGRVFHAPLIGAVPELQLACMVGSGESLATIARADIDVIVIATPHDTHFDLAQRALLAGKHVVIDKPFALSIVEGEQLIALAKSVGRLLTVFHNRRWDGDFLTVRDILAQGMLGEVRLFEAYWDRFRPDIKAGWRESPAQGAGIVWNLAPHLVDQALLLFGLPDAVQADIETQRAAAEVEDYFQATLFYGASRVHLGASSLVAAARPRFAVHGTQGSFVKYGLDPQEDRLVAGGDPLSAGFGEDVKNCFGALTIADAPAQAIPTHSGAYVEFYRALARAIATGAPLPVEPSDALSGLKILEAMHSSAATGAVIKISV